jgi:hypothetical protein
MDTGGMEANNTCMSLQYSTDSFTASGSCNAASAQTSNYFTKYNMHHCSGETHEPASIQQWYNLWVQA